MISLFKNKLYEENNLNLNHSKESVAEFLELPVPTTQELPRTFFGQYGIWAEKEFLRKTYWDNICCN